MKYDEKEGKRNFNVKKHKGLYLAPKFLMLIFILIVLFNLNQVSSETLYCAERTISGAWCQHVPLSQVDETNGYRKAPTSCDATSFCRLGTCVNSNEGICSANVPQRVCQDSGGVWEEEDPEEITQCRLGCCLLGDQAAFVTQTRCKALSSDYGIETNYRADITTEMECLEAANPDVKGACVFDDGSERNCEMLTKSECLTREEESSDTEIEFHEGFLCSAETLATNCGPSRQTTCVLSKDEVYFLDTCGNVANVYDASKIEDQDYWTNIKEETEICGLTSSNGNAGSKTCGNCDYTLGSVCKAFERGNSARPQPQYGNFVCADLSCRYQGSVYQHGESWCSGTAGVNSSLPGSEYSRLVCYSGEVTVEECSAFRQEICAQDETVPGYTSARCKANAWQDCLSQESKSDCENIDERDCKWLEGQSILRDGSGNLLVLNSEGKLVETSQPNTGKQATCVPRYAPGFDFWNEESEAEELCAVANDNCIVKFEKSYKTGFDMECKENCHCIGLSKGAEWSPGYNSNSAWLSNHANICLALGDCGSKKNYIGAQGYYDADDLITFAEGKL